MRISVAYSVPLQVIVDLDTGKVDRVTVIDEDIAPDPEGFSQNADDYTPAGIEARVAAYAIAERADIEWPTWQRGY